MALILLLVIELASSLLFSSQPFCAYNVLNAPCYALSNISRSVASASSAFPSGDAVL